MLRLNYYCILAALPRVRCCPTGASAGTPQIADINDVGSSLPGISGRNCIPRITTNWQQQRYISEEQLNADGSQLAELFDRNMAKASRRRGDGPRILTTRREALHLYREILRYSNLFVWKNESGVMWRDVLRANARKEYEDSRIESDPEIINKLIITGRDAVTRVVESFWKKRNTIIEDEAARHDRGVHLPQAPPQRPPSNDFDK